MAVALALSAAVVGCDAIRPTSPLPTQPFLVPATAAPPSTPAPTKPGPSPSPVVETIAVAIVPVVAWRAAWTATSATEVAEILWASNARYRSVEVTATDRDAILERLVGPSPRPFDAARLIVVPNPAALVADLAAHPDRLGFLRADDVEPAVRAIGWEGIELFGVKRTRTLSDWALSIEDPSNAGGAGDLYDPAIAWTLVAGGDVNLDGNVAYWVKNKGKGVDYPWAGGTARITSRYCCSTYGFEMARVKRTGHGGAIRELLSGADIAIANFENPAPDDFTYHDGGYTFSADPALIEGLRNAGIDWVSLANNHIGNAGPSGIVETLANLDKWGIAHGGAGADLAAARAPSILTAGLNRIAILAYDTIRPGYAATADSPGSNQMSVDRVRKDVAAARDAGADVVIVFPHWGTEYTVEPTKRQRTLAHAAIDAGADMVLGNHTHWVGGMEVYKGRPIVFSLADFVFSIRRSERTMEGILVESTFQGARLKQLRTHPFFIFDGVQPNLLEPDGGAEAVMDQLFEGSGSLLPW